MRKEDRSIDIISTPVSFRWSVPLNKKIFIYKTGDKNSTAMTKGKLGVMAGVR